jgi:hypothetical protein
MPQKKITAISALQYLRKSSITDYSLRRKGYSLVYGGARQ